MQRALDFDKTPALSVPLPLLLNVVFFGLLAGVLASIYGSELFASRWSQAALALTHVWTLGILASAMLGALLQLLAVACNVTVPGIRRLALAVYVLLSAGTLLLGAGFLWWIPGAWLAAAICLAAAFSAYLLTVAAGLWQLRAQVYKGAREILVPVRGALFSLAIAVVLGIYMALSMALGWDLPDWIGSHVLWGLVGWGGLLLMGMTFQLLPIFQITEIYPRVITRWLPLLIPVLLLAWSALQATSGLPRLMLETAELFLLGIYVVWAAVGIQRLLKRKRPVAEATSLFWFTSMGSVIACAPAWVWLTHGNSIQASMVLGVLLIIGVLGAAINGMLYKIIPFLLWKHAQDHMRIPLDQPELARAYLKVLPKMAAYINPRAAQLQWFAYLLVLLCWLLAASGWQTAKLAAGPLLVLSSLLLAGNIGAALLLYRRSLRALAALPHHRA